MMIMLLLLFGQGIEPVGDIGIHGGRTQHLCIGTDSRTRIGEPVLVVQAAVSSCPDQTVGRFTEFWQQNLQMVDLVAVIFAIESRGIYLFVASSRWRHDGGVTVVRTKLKDFRHAMMKIAEDLLCELSLQSACVD